MYGGHLQRQPIPTAFRPEKVEYLKKRLEGLPQEVKKIFWKAQVRLCGRFKRLIARGKSRNSVVTATARELAAFMWAIACAIIPAQEARHRIFKEQN
jgi:hypothetical protein